MIREIEWPENTFLPCMLCGGKAKMWEKTACNYLVAYIECSNPECPDPKGPSESYCGYFEINHKFKTNRDLIREWNEQNAKSLIELTEATPSFLLEFETKAREMVTSKLQAVVKELSDELATQKRELIKRIKKENG